MYGSGNYEAFVRPQKVSGNDKKKAYIGGTGLAALTAACYLVRDAYVPGENIHIFEKDKLPGGACDGAYIDSLGFVMRGGREMDNHFEVMWDLYHSIPSLEHEGQSVLDEYYDLNRKDPNFSHCRATKNRGEDAGFNKKFGLSDDDAMEIMKLFFASDESLYDKCIDEVLSESVLASPFWLYWRTMFAFQNWHSALEMKRYLKRYIHHIGGLPDFSALRFTKYNQYDSMILPMVRYLEDHGVIFHYNSSIVDVTIESNGDELWATQLELLVEGEKEILDLGKDDLVFLTLGGCVENTTLGGQNSIAPMNTTFRPGGGWDLWKRLAKRNPLFGNPDVFCQSPEETNWMSATVETFDDTLFPYIEKITKRKPLTGKVVTGGIVTVKDSSWLLSWTINRQPQCKNQPEGHCLVWLYGLFSDVPGDFVKKPMRQCTGKEICMEWLYHLGVPVEEIEEIASTKCNTVQAMMPYIDAFFMPRTDFDRPKVIVDGAQNFAFLGQFCEIARDTIFTTEYSMRSGMEAVYGLCHVPRAVPEVWGSTYDIRDLLDATVKLRDGRNLSSLRLGFLERLGMKFALEKIHGTDIEKLLLTYGLIKE